MLLELLMQLEPRQLMLLMLLEQLLLLLEHRQLMLLMLLGQLLLLEQLLLMQQLVQLMRIPRALEAEAETVIEAVKQVLCSSPLEAEVLCSSPLEVASAEAEDDLFGAVA